MVVHSQFWSGVHFRIEADAPLDDLEIMDKDYIENKKRGAETRFKNRIETATKGLFHKKDRFQNSEISNALILHLDGDKKYTQKSERYYRKLGLRAIVKNVPENKQPQVIRHVN